MAFSLTQLATLRPYVYHLTSASNLPRVQRTRRLQSAAELARAAGRDALVSVRRREHTGVEIEGETVWLRDQAPLHAGNMALEVGWSFEQFVAHLNERVFFWPGDATGPISYGVRHFSRYAAERPIILRVPLASLIGVNVDATVEVSRCNSGSPRYSRGRAAPRGGNTFLRSSEAGFRPAQVVEVTILGSVMLPENTMWAVSIAGSWHSLT